MEHVGQNERGLPVNTALTVQQVEEQLIAAIATCERQIRRGEEDLARLKDALRSLRRQKHIRPHSNRHSNSDNTAPQLEPDDHRSTARGHEGSAASIIRMFVRKALRDAGRPLNRAEILNRLEQAGIEIDSKVPIKRIGKVMWLSNEFQNVGDGYWFAGEAIPSSNGTVSK